MGITCQSQQTISAVSILVCDHLVKIYDQRVGQSTIDVQIAGQIFPQVGLLASHQGNEIWTLQLISKNDGAGTAVLKFTISNDPCIGVTCPDTCVGSDLQHYTCDSLYDSNNIPIGYECVPDGSPIPNSPACAATHNLDIYVRPHSWYTPGGAASQITNILANVSGAIINGMAEAGLTNWAHLDTSIITETDRVIIRVYLKEITPSLSFSTYPTLLSTCPTLSSTCPEIRTLALGPWVIIAIAIGVVIIGIGIIVGYALYKAAMTLLGETYTKGQVGQYTNDILTKTITNCTTNYPTDPVGYANCVKSGIQSVTSAGQDFFNDSTIGQSGQTAASNINNCIADYNNPSSPKYHDSTILKTCVDTQNQNVQTTMTNQTKSKGSPFGAILLLGIGLLGMYIVTKPAGEAIPIIIKESRKGE